jgi:leucyl aminopeptidase
MSLALKIQWVPKLCHDVIKSYSGHSTEIIGYGGWRLILADGIAYLLKKLQSPITVDIATLTGSSVETLWLRMWCVVY